jgi:hypothetical protein
MLDLKKMQRELDDQLNKETTESLLAWLRKKRVQRFESYFGDGDCELYYGQNLKFILKQYIDPQIVDGGDDYIGNTHLAQAA